MLRSSGDRLFGMQIWAAERANIGWRRQKVKLGNVWRYEIDEIVEAKLN